MEILLYIIAGIICILFSLGLMGAFDNDEDNPFKYTDHEKDI